MLVLISAREMVSESGKKKRVKVKEKKYTARTSTLRRKIILSYEEDIKGMNTLNIILAE